MARVLAYFCLVFLIGPPASAQNDIFSSISNLEPLLDAEADLVDGLQRYIRREERRLEDLRRMSRELVMDNARFADSKKNPISIFLMLKRWLESDLIKTMKKNEAEEILETLRQTLPEEQDLRGAAVALIRLQATYKLRVEDLVAGKLTDTISTAYKLSTDDCFQIGKIAYETGDFHYALKWLEMTWKLMRDDNVTKEWRAKVLDYYSFTLHKTGNLQRAFWYAKLILRYEPDHVRAGEYVEFFGDQLAQEGQQPVRSLKELPPMTNSRAATSKMKKFEKLCRGEKLANIVRKDEELSCYLKTTPINLKLAPIKIEPVSSDPEIKIIHDIFTLKEGKTLIELAKPKLRRALIIDRSLGKEVPADYRIAKNAWLYEEENPDFLERIAKRFEQATDLDMEFAEKTQIANYGLGGHYETHFDMSTNGALDPYSDGRGNRIATVLVYLEQPEAGGGTTFNDLGILVPPTKNNAVFWYNLYRNGTADKRLLHGACPVLSGVKWVANRWIRQRGQELRRLCSLDPNA